MASAPIPSIFEFEATTLYKTEKTEAALREHPALFINHLSIARRLEEWAEGQPSMEGFHAGFRDALLDVAAHLRQADYLPGSPELDL